MSRGRASASPYAGQVARWAALGLLSLALLAVNCSAHAFLRSPRSRVIAQNVLGNAPGDIEYVASSGNGGGTGGNPRVCGDPHQGGNEMGMENRAGNPEGESHLRLASPAQH